MFVEKVIGRSKRCNSVFQSFRRSQRPNYRDHAYFHSLNGSTVMGNFSPSYSLASRLFSSKAAAPGNSFIGLQTHLHSYSTFANKESGGPRLNEEVQAEFVRLVYEDGHRIVSRNQALEQARKLELDLVEVQGNADPPVCKLMDFHREKYKKQLKEKERVKTKKSEVTLKSESKEVRFSGNIDKRDLQMKANTVIAWLEGGYRVKCMIVPPKKREPNKKRELKLEDAEDVLSRIRALFQDVALVESGPSIVMKRVEKTLGDKKKEEKDGKGGKTHKKLEKKLKNEKEDHEEKLEVKHAFVVYRHVKFGPSKKGGSKKPTVTTEQPAEPSPVIFDEDCTESGLETEEEENEVDLPTPLIKTPVLDPMRIENRYSRSEPSINQFTAAKPMEDMRPDFSNQRRPPPPLNMNNPHSARENNFANNRPPSQQVPGRYFNAPGKQGPTEDVIKKDDGNRYGNQNVPDPKSDNQQQPGGQRRFGIFSR